MFAYFQIDKQGFGLVPLPDAFFRFPAGRGYLFRPINL
ncbi:hypothetical protein FTUN_8720 [Frigoriglobus tundricola]|uniref:Uncharacterized protein n=1 Tax=Frigoriglobus tundricola TaxID=2774151 RepID=A0A6M5Z6T6_9BACT|nr:hypothetical protein FTUN_8720 [Frigoriglobus tundricola]